MLAIRSHFSASERFVPILAFFCPSCASIQDVTARETLGCLCLIANHFPVPFFLLLSLLRADDVHIFIFPHCLNATSGVHD